MSSPNRARTARYRNENNIRRSSQPRRRNDPDTSNGTLHGNAPPLTDPTTGLVFPDLNALGEEFQTNLIMPEPTIFLDRKFPVCSIIRPTQTVGAAMGAVKALTDNGLFIGQSPEFFAALKGLAQAADAARHGA